MDTEVENSLLKRAKGYTAKIKKTFKVKKVEYDPSGKKIKEEEVLEVGEDEIHVPADVTAMIFWLKNRLPEKWKDKQFAVSDIADADEAMQTGVILMADVNEEVDDGTDSEGQK